LEAALVIPEERTAERLAEGQIMGMFAVRFERVSSGTGEVDVVIVGSWRHVSRPEGRAEGQKSSRSKSVWDHTLKVYIVMRRNQNKWNKII
jgi:hypothetical protein